MWLDPSLPAFADSLRLADCTLREGQLQAGVVFQEDEKVRVAMALDTLGVCEIEEGTPGVSEEDASAVRRLVKAGANRQRLVRHGGPGRGVGDSAK